MKKRIEPVTRFESIVNYWKGRAEKDARRIAISGGAVAHLAELRRECIYLYLDKNPESPAFRRGNEVWEAYTAVLKSRMEEFRPRAIYIENPFPPFPTTGK